MNRDYKTDVDGPVAMFIGDEIELTPAHGMRTLFVVCVQPVEDIFSKAEGYGCRHIYFGANQSFPVGAIGVDTWKAWDHMVRHFLKQDFICTLDFDVSVAEGVLEMCLSEYHNFIPMISVKLPYLQQLGYNATIKLDDRDFKYSNPGVWCHSLHDLLDRKKFTDWSAYKQDTVLK